MVSRRTLSPTLLLAVLGIAGAAHGSGCADQDGPDCSRATAGGVDGGLVCGRPFSFQPSQEAPALFAVQAYAYVAIDLAGVVHTEGPARVLVLLSARDRLDGKRSTQDLEASVCHVRFPDIPVPGQRDPTTLTLNPRTYEALPPRSVSGSLEPPETCGKWSTTAATFLFGTRLESPDAPLPTSETFRPCATESDTGCTLDVDQDGQPGVTLLVEDMPLVDVSELHVVMRVRVALTGTPVSGERLLGSLRLSLDLSILSCRVRTGRDTRPCSEEETNLVLGLRPTVQQLAEPDSPFAALRVPPGTTCADIRANESMLFGH